MTVEADEPERAPEAVEAAAYFVVSEAPTNVARHANARQKVVRVAHANGLLQVEVEDDGLCGAAEGGPPRGLRTGSARSTGTQARGGQRSATALPSG